MLNDISTPPPEPKNDLIPGRQPPPLPGERPGLTQPPYPHVGPQDMGPTRPGARRPAPLEPGVRPHTPIHPHGEPMEPGVNHARIMGDAVRTDVIYDTEPADRGSTFSVGLSIAAAVVVAAVALFVAYWMFR